MPELILKIGTTGVDPDYQDGDILAAFNVQSIKRCHAEMICHYRNAGFTKDGLRPNTSLYKVWAEAVSQYRFERTGRQTFKRILIATETEVPLTGSEQMDVELFIKRRLLHPKHRICGTLGREVWYGGKETITPAALNTAWAAIETTTPLREVNHRLWPLGTQDKRSHLALAVDDFSKGEAEEFIKPEIEPGTIPDPSDDGDLRVPVILRRRLHDVDWKSLTLSKSVASIEDKNMSIDVRGDLFVHSTIVKTKP